MKIWILITVSITAHVAAFGQADLDSIAQRQHAVIERIEQEQSAVGPFSPGLIEPLQALAVLYEEDGNDVLAFATFERALQLIRANYGLYSLEQVAVMRRMLEMAKARGSTLEAWEFDQRLVEVAERNAGDLRAVPLFREIGQKRVALLEEYLAGEYPPELVLGCYLAYERYARSSTCLSGSLQDAVRGLLTEAHDNYLAAIDTLLQHEMYDSEELRELEWAIVRSGRTYGRYLVGTAGCQRVQERLMRLHEYDLRNEVSLEQRAGSLVQVADWELYCQWNAAALHTYEKVLAMLADGRASQSNTDGFFRPEIPVLLPAFEDSGLTTSPAVQSARYVELAFELTRFGTTRKIKVLEGKKLPGADKVVDLVRRKRFRPFARDGALVDSPRLVVRYYLDEPLNSDNRP